MKKMIRILSVALIAAMLLSLSAVALAADVTVYIPSKLSKMGLPDMLNYDGIPTRLISLRTKTDCAWTGDYKTKSDGSIKYDYNGNPIKHYGVVEDAEIHLHFSRRPDWAGVSWSNGWENLEIDDAGDAVTSIEGHPIQPGMWAASGPCEIDPETGKSKPSWYVSGGDYPYSGGKDWGNGLTVNYNWQRNGLLYQVEYKFDGEDFFRTGIEGATSSIVYKRVIIETDCGKDGMWYVAQVKATYPAGNPIVAVEADYRNDEKTELCSYRISYATSETEVYKITYAPKTTSVFEDHSTGKVLYNKLVVGYDKNKKPVTTPFTVGSNDPSVNADPYFVHHYTADEPIYGEYYVDGTLVAVSGSGNKLNKWYKPGHGKQIKKPGLRGVSSFTSIRVK